MNAMNATQEWIRVLQMENKFVRVVPSNNADADPSSSCVRDYSCLSSMTAGKKTNWDQKFKISITQNRSAQNQLQSWSKMKTPARILVKMKTPAQILVSSPRMATHNVPKRASSQIEKSTIGKLSTRTITKCPREQISDNKNRNKSSQISPWPMLAPTASGSSTPSWPSTTSSPSP